MRIGRMDRRVSIEQATESNTKGSVSLSWAELDEVWAAVIEREGAESHDDDQVVARRTLTFRIRYRSDVTEKMRVKYPTGGSVTYDIREVRELGRREGLDLVAVAAVG